MKELVPFELTKEYRDRFQEALNDHDVEFIRQSLEEVNAADITALLYEFNSEESKYVLDLLTMELRSEIIRDLDPEARKSFLKVYAPKDIAAFLNQLDSDDSADILNELPIKEREEIIGLVDNEVRSQVIELLRYDANVAGGLMAKELIKARNTWTVAQATDEARRMAATGTKFYAVYIVDDNDKLLGRMPLQRLILTSASAVMGDLIDEEELVSVETYMPDYEVAELMKKYDLESIPVVNVQGQLVGRITIDDIVDVITEQNDADRQAMTGITEDVEEDDSIWKNTRARLPWLVIGIMGGLISARLMGSFEEEIQRIAAIAFFIPLIQATGGNVGIQSSSVVVQSLVAPGIVDERLFTRLSKVLAVAVLNGLVLSILVFAATALVFGYDKLNLIVSIALFGVVIFASFIGTVTPLALNKFGFNPALASGPFITTLNDLLGLGVYFLTIQAFL